MTPTGPTITYQAIPCMAPESVQQLLRVLSRDARAAKEFYGNDSPHHRDLIQAMDVATLQIREEIGVEVIRPSFLPGCGIPGEKS